MLVFISAGINFDLTLSGLEELKNCDEIYAEIYTSPIPSKIVDKLESNVGKHITLIERDKVESNFLVNKAKDKTIGLIVVGDALIATTHISLLIECKHRGIEIKVIHNSSIISAAMGKSGLQAYRFGKSATLPYWKRNYEPVSPLEIVGENLERNLHTILFLDVDKELGPMEAMKGIESIKKIETKLGRKIIEDIIILSRVGYSDEKISFGKIHEMEGRKLGKPLVIFIIPAKLHILEKEYLEFFKV